MQTSIHFSLQSLVDQAVAGYAIFTNESRGCDAYTEVCAVA